MNFSFILKELRQERDLTHQQLAEKIGYSKAIIGFWESGKYEPTGKALASLAKFFNVTTDYLLNLENDFGNKQLPNSASNSQLQLAPVDRQILDELQEMDEFQKQHVLGYIHGFRRVAFSVKKTNRD